MSILGSAAGRALSGAGAAAGRLASKYIDEELAQQRAQFLADLQFQSGKRTEEYMQSPEVQGRRRENARQDALTAGATKGEVELAELNNQPLQGARTAAKDRDFDADTGRKIRGRKQELTELTPAEVEAQNTITTGTADARAKSEGLLAEARAKAQAKYREPRADDPAAISRKMAEIEKVMGRPLTEAEKATVLGLVSKNARDPELDTETITEERMGEDGTVTKTQRKQVRRPGQGGEAAQPSDDPIKAAMDKARAERAAAEASRKAPKQPAAAGAAPSDPIQAMDTATLKRIANIDGHTNQQKAQAELERRGVGMPMSTGDGSTASMLNAAP